MQRFIPKQEKCDKIIWKVKYTPKWSQKLISVSSFPNKKERDILTYYGGKNIFYELYAEASGQLSPDITEYLQSNKSDVKTVRAARDASATNKVRLIII